MPWHDTARVEHRRDSQRYPSDLTAREWALIAPLLPAAKRGGRPRSTDLRAVVDAILYIASSGCQSLPGRAFEKCPRGGGCCRRTFRRFPRFRAISTHGATAACGRASTTFW
jgi:hypothetical protein